MPRKPHRIIVDTNLWVSFLITQDLRGLDNLILSRKVVLLFSQELLDEFILVAQRPKFRRYFSKDDLEELIEIIADYAEVITVTSTPSVCRDSKDNFLLALAADGDADYLLTGDQDLLELHPFGSTSILRVSDFLQTV